jgi:hypothetical protein
MSDEQSRQISNLEQTVDLLTDRVWRLEQAVTQLSVDALRSAASPAAPSPRPVEAQRPPVPTPAPAPPQRPAPPPRPPKPPKPAVDWGKLAAQLFEARTLA